MRPRRKSRSRRRPKEKKANSNSGSQLRTYSFLATIIVIIVVIVASYLSSMPTIEHMPSAFQFYTEAWMPYIPSETQNFVYIDYARARLISGGTQLFGAGFILSLSQLSLDIFPQDMLFEIDMQLPSPTYSGTVTIMRLQDAKLDALTDAINHATQAPRWQYGDHSIVSLLMQRAGEKAGTLGYLCTVNSYVVFSTDQTAGRKSVERTLDQFSSSIPNLTQSLFDNMTIRRAVYAAGLTNQACIGLFIGRFPVQLQQSTMIVKSIVQEDTTLVVTRSIMFSNGDIALSHFGEAHHVYRGASTYQVIDSWIVVTYQYPVSELTSELTGL